MAIPRLSTTTAPTPRRRSLISRGLIFRRVIFRGFTPKQRRPHQRQFLHRPKLLIVLCLGHPRRHAIHTHTQQRLRRLPPRLHRHIVLQRQLRQPIHRKHPHPRQRQLCLHIREHPHPRHRPAGLQRRRPRREFRRRHPATRRRLRHVLHPAQHHLQQRIVPRIAWRHRRIIKHRTTHTPGPRATPVRTTPPARHLPTPPNPADHRRNKTATAHKILRTFFAKSCAPHCADQIFEVRQLAV